MLYYIGHIVYFMSCVNFIQCMYLALSVRLLVSLSQFSTSSVEYFPRWRKSKEDKRKKEEDQKEEEEEEKKVEENQEDEEENDEEEEENSKDEEDEEEETQNI